MNENLPTKSDIEKITTKSTWSAALYVVIIVLLTTIYSMQKDSCVRVLRLIYLWFNTKMKDKFDYSK